MDNEKTIIFELSKSSTWTCYMFGNKPGGNGLIYQPIKGCVPNIFIRWMMKICFACTWKNEKNDG